MYKKVKDIYIIYNVTTFVCNDNWTGRRTKKNLVLFKIKTYFNI